MWVPDLGAAPVCGVDGRAFRTTVASSEGCRIGPSYRTYGAGSLLPIMIGLGAHAIVRLSDSVGVIYMWAESGGFVAPGVTADRSLSPRTAGDSYTRGKEYSSGSVSRPPGSAALIPPNTRYLLHHREYSFLGLRFLPSGDPVDIPSDGRVPCPGSLERLCKGPSLSRSGKNRPLRALAVVASLASLYAGSAGVPLRHPGSCRPAWSPSSGLS